MRGPVCSDLVGSRFCGRCGTALDLAALSSAPHCPTCGWIYIGSGPAVPSLVYAVIENPKDSIDRMVYDHSERRFISAGWRFPDPLPVHYGWIPQTLTDADGEELDLVVLGEGYSVPGSMLTVRPIGTLLREGGDHKVVGLRVDLTSAYRSAFDASERADIREMVEVLFRPRPQAIFGWASAVQTHALILQGQRAWAQRDAGIDP